MLKKYHLIHLRLLGFVVFLVAALSVAAYAGTSHGALHLKNETFASLIDAAFLENLKPQKHNTDLQKLSYVDEIKEFYARRSNKPLWLSDKTSMKRFTGMLEDSWTHGLNPASYHLDAILKILRDSTLTDTQKATLEILLTSAAIEYARDLTGMRVKQAAIDEDSSYWRQPLPAEGILELLQAASDPATALETVVPQGGFYNALREELIYLSSLPYENTEGDELDFGKAYFFPGDRHPDVALLRSKLETTGIYSGLRDPALYDDALAASVMSFQKKHDLQPDGIIGPNTLAALNFDREDMIGQIIANLERLRWLEQQYPDRYLLVNIPSQKLWAVENGRAVHEMNVVVGKPSRPTKRFVTDVNGVRFNPSWNVPVSIKMKDFLPNLKEDPYALSDKGIEFIRGYGDNAVTLDPGSINWHAVTYDDMRQIRMVQTPGDHNALGRIRILMHNKYDIYLHDTNHKSLFNDKTRAYSSGCIRMEEPENIADFILGSNPDWHSGKVREYLQSTQTTEIAAAEKLPVYIVYQTMWLDGQGQLVYGPDIYNKDKDLLKALALSEELPAYGEGVSAAPSLASAVTIQ